MPKTIEVGGRELPLDDTRASVAHVDVFTETGATDGVVYLGLGQVIGAQRIENGAVLDVVHLRMGPPMARRIARHLVANAEAAERQLLEGQPNPPRTKN